MTPELSILLVSYDSLADLARCLPTILVQDYTRYEVIVVDNHGHDGVAEFLATHQSTVRVLSNPANSGYAGGNNLGLQHVRGQWVLLLNPDTELHIGFLTTLLSTARAHPDAFITPKLLNPDGATVNACGNQMHYTGITTCRGLNEPSEMYKGLETVPLLSGAAFVAPTKAMRQLGGFDESYFMYFEDTDLSLRARLRGYQLLCQADAVAVHHYQLGMSPIKFYYLERNRLLTLGKVLSRRMLFELLPALLLTELATWVFALRGLAYVRARGQAYSYLWKHRRFIRQARQVVQATRQVSDRDLLRQSTTALPINQVSSTGVSNALMNGIDRVYRLLRPAVLR